MNFVWTFHNLSGTHHRAPTIKLSSDPKHDSGTTNRLPGIEQGMRNPHAFPNSRRNVFGFEQKYLLLVTTIKLRIIPLDLKLGESKWTIRKP